MKDFKSLSIIATEKGVSATYYYSQADGKDFKKEISVGYGELDYPDDFMYACVYLVDRMEEKLNAPPFEGRAVCSMNEEREAFTVGRIYQWVDGRTIDDNAKIFPRGGKIVELNGVIETDLSELKFIKIVE